MKVTQREVTEHISELFNAIDGTRPIDVILNKYKLSNLRAKRRECFEMVNYLMDHPLRAFKYTHELDRALNWLESEAIREINRLERISKQVNNDPRNDFI